MARETKEAKKPTTRKKSNRPNKEVKGGLKDEIWSIIIVAVGIFLIIALQTEATALLGRAVANLFFGSFGFVAYILPYCLILYGVLLFVKKSSRVGGRFIIFFSLIFVMIAIMNASRFIDAENISYSFTEIFNAGIALEGGGIVGTYIGNVLVMLVGHAGLFIISLVVIFISALLLVNTPISQFLDTMKAKRAARKEREFEDYEDEEASYEDTSNDDEVKRKARDKEPSRFAGLMSRGQMKVLEYVKDNNLFEKSESESEAKESADDYVNETITDGNITEQSMTDTRFDSDFESELDTVFDTEQNSELNFEQEQFEQEQEIDDSPEFAYEREKMGIQTIEHLDYPEPSESPLPERKLDYGVFAKEVDEVEIASKTIGVASNEASKIAGQARNDSKTKKPAYRLPPLEFLSKGKEVNKNAVNATLNAKGKKLEETLKNFNVDAKVLQVTQGPAVTRYEIQPNVGVKVNSIVRLADDIALNLEAKSIRLEAPIPGKAAVGIEVENDKVNMVTLGDILSSNEFKNAASKITFAVGRDISGNAITADLKSMPHMLIAGATGSGKSVCINSIIMSILYKATPDEVKLVLIDPKVVELGNYNGIPHLLIPVVTDPTKASAALLWAVTEMTERYKKFEEEGVKELASYNNSVKEKDELDKVLPQIVIIIDELADLMMVASSQVEQSICRLAQMARAAGMHLIIATQRPSVDVITGVIKANVPSRIAFAVSSQFDSRTILDMAGAEKLVGKGDMLFNPIGSAKPSRVQGTFVSDSEIHKVIEFVKAQAVETEYSSDVIHSIEKTNNDGGDDGDELLAEAIESVVKSKQASASALQRRFRIGYN